MGKKIIKGFLITIASLLFVIGLLFVVVILTYDDSSQAANNAAVATTTLQEQTTPEPTEPPTTTPPPSRMGRWSEISIIGDSSFISQSEAALQIIRSQTPDIYEWVVHYVGILRQYYISGMWHYLDPPEFRIGTESYSGSVTWLAGIIVHDAKHSMQAYHAPGTFDDPYSQSWADAEYEANLYQMEFFRRINAPLSYITHLEELNRNILQGEGWWLTEITW